MLTIKLAKIGKKKYHTFQIIITEKTKDTSGNYLELLGSHNPHTNKSNLKIDRIKYWLSKGAQTTDVVHNLLVEQKIITSKKVRVVKVKKKEEKEKAEAKPVEKVDEKPKKKSEEKPKEKSTKSTVTESPAEEVSEIEKK